MKSNTEDVERIIASTYSNGSISDSLPGGLREKFKEEQVDKIISLIQQEANHQKAELLDRLEQDDAKLTDGRHLELDIPSWVEAERAKLKEMK